MIIQYCSDLHSEFAENRQWLLYNPIIPKAEILILAGDIIPFIELPRHQKFLDEISTKFKHTYWIPGNHEYYGGDLSRRSGSFEEHLRENISLLNNKTIHLNGVKMIFTTLWSQISPKQQIDIKRGLSDFRLIQYNNKALEVQHYNKMHQQSRAFLEKAVKNKAKTPTLVCSHHLPTFLNYPSHYIDSPLNQAFATDMNEFITQNHIDYWIYGHHHSNVDEFTVGQTQLITNQLGYVHRNEFKNFRNDATFSIG